MNLKFYKPADLDRNLKATIHRTGKLGFTAEAAKKLGLSIEKGLQIGLNEDDSEDLNLYVIVEPTYVEDEMYKVSQASGYFYANAKDLFDNLDYDYSNPDKSFTYDIKESTIDGTKIYVFKRRM